MDARAVVRQLFDQHLSVTSPAVQSIQLLQLHFLQVCLPNNVKISPALLDLALDRMLVTPEA